MADFSWETKFGYPARLIVGVDEVGRGCLAGPVTAAAVILPASLAEWSQEITDSKKLTSSARERLAPLIRESAVALGIGMASVDEIDEINIYHASHLAMERAVLALVASGERSGTGPLISHILIDGNKIPKKLAESYETTAIVQGDLKSMSIAAASIIAKVYRDQLMTEIDAVYPGYGFAVHKGYGTPRHLEALRTRGVCAIHRRSFAPVAEALFSGDGVH
jgi:ribonuclease HII